MRRLVLYTLAGALYLITITGCATNTSRHSVQLVNECEQALYLAEAERITSAVNVLKLLRNNDYQRAIRALETSLEQSETIIKSSGRPFDKGLETNVIRALEIAKRYRATVAQ